MFCFLLPNVLSSFCCRSNYEIIADSFCLLLLQPKKVFDMYINCLSDSVVSTNDSFHVVCCLSYIRCQDDNRSFFVYLYFLFFTSSFTSLLASCSSSLLSSTSSSAMMMIMEIASESNIAENKVDSQAKSLRY